MKYRNGEEPLHIWRTDHDVYPYVSMRRDAKILRHHSDGRTYLESAFDLIETYDPEQTVISENDSFQIEVLDIQIKILRGELLSQKRQLLRIETAIEQLHIDQDINPPCEVLNKNKNKK